MLSLFFLSFLRVSLRMTREDKARQQQWYYQKLLHHNYRDTPVQVMALGSDNRKVKMNARDGSSWRELAV